LVSVAVAISGWDFGTSAIVDGARAIAYATGVQCSDARIDIVTNAVAVCICGAGSSANADGVFLVPVTVAIPSRDCCATTFENGTWSVANTTGVQRSDAVVHIVADVIVVGVCCAITTAIAEGVELVTVTVTVARRNVRAPTFVDGSRTSANATGVIGQA